MKPLVTILGGVAESMNDDVTIIDFDDWNSSNISNEWRQERIEEIQEAGYRCVVHENPDNPERAWYIQIFKPDQDYADYITNTVPDSHSFVVYDPK